MHKYTVAVGSRQLAPVMVKLNSRMGQDLLCMAKQKEIVCGKWTNWVQIPVLLLTSYICLFNISVSPFPLQ